jgi:hypothetical protein
MKQKSSLAEANEITPAQGSFVAWKRAIVKSCVRGDRVRRPVPFSETWTYQANS